MLTEEAPGNSGECRRHAPTRIMADTPEHNKSMNLNSSGCLDEGGEAEECRRVWPLTYWMDWCGDYRACGPEPVARPPRPPA